MFDLSLSVVGALPLVPWSSASSLTYRERSDLHGPASVRLVFGSSARSRARRRRGIPGVAGAGVSRSPALLASEQGPVEGSSRPPAGSPPPVLRAVAVPAFAQEADGANPKPIPPGFEMEGQKFHVYLNEPGNEPSTIGDFRGLVAINHLQGMGTVIRGGPNGGLATPTATGDRIGYDADMRIMKGQYIGEDGQEHEGTFGFI